MDQFGHSLECIRYPGDRGDVAVLQLHSQVVEGGRALEYLGDCVFVDLHPRYNNIYSL